MRRGAWRALGVSAVVVAGLASGSRRWSTLDGEAVATVAVRRGAFLREVEARGTLKAVKATPVVVPPDLQRAQTVSFLAPDGARLKAGDVVAAFDPHEAEREAADGRADLSAAQARVDKAVAEGTRNARTLRLDRDLAQDQLERAEAYKVTDEDILSRHQIVESRLDRELFAARAGVAEGKLGASGRQAATERALGEIEAGKARLKIAAAENGLRSLRVTAPHDGLLTLERGWTGEAPAVGSTLWPGQKIGELPDLSRLEARVFVLETDAAGLAPGLHAQLEIEGRPGETHEASVARVEPLAKPRGRTPVKYFEATLALATDASTMRPGQQVRARIRLEQADGVLAVPRGAVFERDGRRVVYRRAGRGFEPVAVTVERQSISHVVIATGLAEGDVVALRDPGATRDPAPPAAGARGAAR